MCDFDAYLFRRTYYEKNKNWILPRFMIYNTINDYLNNNADNIVCFCVASFGNEKLVRNLLKSAELLEIPIIVFALDLKIAEKLKNICDVILYVSEINVDANKFYEFGSKSFKSVIYQRFLIGNELLKFNKTIIYLDTDIVIKKDFRTELNKQINESNVDAIFQFNGRHANTGFYIMRPTNKTIDLFTQDFLNKNHYLEYDRNQVFFQKRVVGKKLININFLSRIQYPNGKYYYSNSPKIDTSCRIIHFNHVVGESEKILKMKKYGYWFI